jgi:hypothetical protein
MDKGEELRLDARFYQRKENKGTGYDKDGRLLQNPEFEQKLIQLKIGFEETVQNVFKFPFADPIKYWVRRNCFRQRLISSIIKYLKRETSVRSNVHAITMFTHDIIPLSAFWPSIRPLPFLVSFLFGLVTHMVVSMLQK